MLTKDFVSCVHVRFYFFTAAHFQLAASMSHFLTAVMKVFLPTKFVSLALSLLST